MTLRLMACLTIGLGVSIPAAAQTTLLGNITTNTTAPLASGDCLYVSQGTSGSTGTDTKLCPGSAVAFAAAWSALAVANDLSDLANPAMGRTNLGLGAGNSPTFTGLALSGLSNGCVQAASGALTSTGLGCGTTGLQSYTVVTPSGGGANSDFAAVQAALNNSATNPVLLRGGKFDVCHELMIPVKGLLIMDSSRSGGDINYSSSAGPPASYFACTGAFVGNAHVGFVGEYGYARGLAVSQTGSDGTSLTNGTISGTTLTVSPCGVLQLAQGITDNYSGGFHITTGSIVTAIGSCVSGHQTYTLNKASTISTPEPMEAAVACAEVIDNASWVTLQDFFLNGCSGDGLRYIADSTKPGAQNTNGLLLRPRIFNGQSFNNGGDGVHYDVLQEDGSAAVTDVVIDSVDMGANGGDGINLALHTGGQVQITNVKADFNGGACMTMSPSFSVINTMICDNDYNWYRISTPAWAEIYLDLQSFSGEYLQMSNVEFNRRDAVATTGLYFASAAFVTFNNITNLNMPIMFAMNPSADINVFSTFQINDLGNQTYLDALTQNSIEPLVTNVSGTRTASLSSNTFTFNFAGGIRNFEIDFPATCSPSPCVIGPPPAVPPGLHGTFNYVQPSGAFQSTAAFDAAFYRSTVPTGFTARGGARDTQDFVTDKTGHIILKPIQLDLTSGPAIVQTAHTFFGDPAIPPGTVGTLSLTGVASGDMAVVRVSFCGTVICAPPTAVISSVTSTTGACTQVIHGLETGSNVGAVDHWICPNLASGSQTFTITSSGANITRADATVTEFTKVPTSPVDGSVARAATDGGTPANAVVTSGSMLAADMAFSTAWWGFNSASVPVGFTGINAGCGVGSGFGMCDSYKTGVSAGTVTADSSASGPDNFVAVISGYKAQ